MEFVALVCQCGLLRYYTSLICSTSECPFLSKGRWLNTALESVQIWFPHYVQAIQEDISKWALEKVSIGDPKLQVWEFARNADKIKSALQHFTVGKSRNKFAETIREKLGDDLNQV